MTKGADSSSPPMSEMFRRDQHPDADADGCADDPGAQLVEVFEKPHPALARRVVWFVAGNPMQVLQSCVSQGPA
jgi:hypothetical protein